MTTVFDTAFVVLLTDWLLLPEWGFFMFYSNYCSKNNIFGDWSMKQTVRWAVGISCN